MKLTYLLILVCQIPFFSYAENSKNIVNHDSCFVISGSGYSYIEEYKCKSKHVVIPSTVNGNTIFGISRWAFDQMDIESVELPETIRYIGDNAFSHNKLKIIRFSSNIISIGFKAFAGNELVSVHFPEKAKIS
ncbi:MAG: leucine-rich repeat protein, partial [Bdellovibrionales bacterium]|nr:leucine-rich repeat protein [Bdellovibrionales bacterium]